MGLDLQTIKTEIQNPRHKELLRSAMEHEARVRLHTEIRFKESYSEFAFKKFTTWAKKLMTAAKYRQLLDVIVFPLSTLPVTKLIYNHFNKMFSGSDSALLYYFTDQKYSDDWEDYKAEVQLVETDAWKAFKTHFNSLVVVDLPQPELDDDGDVIAPDDPLPRPYGYILTLDRILAMGEIVNEVPEWIIFTQTPTTIAVFDNMSWDIWETAENSPRDIKGTEPILSAAHELGLCPVRFILTDKLNDIEREHPISQFVSKLDYLLLYMYAKDILDLYGPFPITHSFKIKCKYADDKRVCESGKLKWKGNDTWIMDRDGGLKSCPSCSANKLNMPASHISVDTPSLSNDKADLRNPFGVSVIPVDNLQEVTAILTDRKIEIIEGICGASHEVISNKAVNQDQVLSLFESGKDSILQLQPNFEKLKSWYDDIICKIRYGDNYLQNSISYGEEKYLFSSQQILESYEEAKSNGADTNVLDVLLDMYYNTKYKDNPEEMKRQAMISNLDPVRHMTAREVIAIKADLPWEDYALKINFSSYIKRFEREHADIVKFGTPEMPLRIKIDSILAILYSYLPAEPVVEIIDEPNFN